MRYYTTTHFQITNCPHLLTSYHVVLNDYSAVTRDVFTWLPKMKMDVYDPHFDWARHANFSSFIRSNYTAICQPITHPECRKINGRKKHTRHESKNETTGELLVSYEPSEIQGVKPFEVAENVIQIRTMKYKQWLNADGANKATYQGREDIFLRNTLQVRLESLVQGNGPLNGDCTSKELHWKFVGSLLQDRCVNVANEKEFVPKVEYTKWKVKGGAKKKFDSKKEREMLDVYSKEDLRFVLSQLDLEFEKSIGYDYKYVDDYLLEE